MKLPKFIVPILSTSFVVILVALRMTGVVQYYSIPTSANEPQLMVGSRVFASNLKSYKNGDFVCYSHKDERSGDHIRVHRLTGREGDRIELKKGVLYINEKDFDKDIHLQHYYSIPNEKSREIRIQKLISQAEYPVSRGNATMIALTDRVATEHGLAKYRMYDPFDRPDHEIKKRWREDWTVDNFGPLVVPSGKIFVLGDSRHSSEDSRYVGVMDETAIVGTVLFR